jgi:hypothetical protein
VLYDFSLQMTLENPLFFQSIPLCGQQKVKMLSLKGISVLVKPQMVRFIWDDQRLAGASAQTCVNAAASPFL